MARRGRPDRTSPGRSTARPGTRSGPGAAAGRQAAGTSSSRHTTASWCRRRSGRGDYPGPFGRAGAARTARSPPAVVHRKEDEDDPIAIARRHDRVDPGFRSMHSQPYRWSYHPVRATVGFAPQIGHADRLGCRPGHRPGAAEASCRRRAGSPPPSAWYQSIVRAQPVLERRAGRRSRTARAARLVSSARRGWPSGLVGSQRISPSKPMRRAISVDELADRDLAGRRRG